MTPPIRIRRGLDLTLEGAAGQRIETGVEVRHVAVTADDHIGLRPRLAVAVGDRVKCGQLLFTDRRSDGLRFTAPGAGDVVAVHRAAKRRLVSVVIRVDGDDAIAFPQTDARELLVASGLWTAIRSRPFGKTPLPDARPTAIFVTAIDTDPLAPDPAVVLRGCEADFTRGLQLLGQLGPVHLCRRPGAAVPDGGAATHEFAGPHPAGLPGTHIHFVAPASRRRPAWHVGYQDVVAMGALARTGRLSVARVVAIAGPMVERPALVRTRIGASTDDLLAGRVRAGATRVVAGSVLSGRAAAGPNAFLGWNHRQITVLSDERTRPFLGWLRPTRRTTTTATHGEPRAIVPIGAYERVMPLDLLPTPLLKALEVDDLDRAVELGCLELIEEDLALCSYVCPGKGEFGASLRRVLDTIEREG